MPTINGNVKEKWTGTPLQNLLVTVNGSLVTRTNDQGQFSITAPNGTFRLCIVEETKAKSYEENCRNMMIVSDTTLNIEMTPVFRAL